MSNNNFKFSVYQEDDLLIEKEFPAMIYNPPVRNTVNIKKLIPYISINLQQTLSRKTSDLIMDYYDYNNDKLYKETFKLYYNKLESPKEKSWKLNNDKTISGVLCRFKLSIGEYTIVERDFYVKYYNTMVRYSYDLYFLVNEIIEKIENKLIPKDVNLMWEDYDLIHRFNLNIQQIREMDDYRRKSLLAKL